MEKKLNILIVEDSEDDTLLLLRELRHGGYDPLSERVETPEGMKSALEARPWDAVISDYIMPKFSGLAALSILHQSGLDLPFIIVSGNIGEDIAVGAMKAGAHDYIIKGNLTRLVPAVERELREAEVRRERRRSAEALRDSERLLRTVLEMLPVGVWITDTTGGLVRGNYEGKRIWAGAQFAGGDLPVEPRGWWLHSGKPVEKDQWASMRALQHGETSLNEEIMIECLDGTRKVILNSSLPIRDERQEVTGAIIVNQDITALKETEGRIKATNDLLKLYTQTVSRKEYQDAAVSLISAWSGCRQAGIRIVDREGKIPYVSYSGFPPDFLDAEKGLALNHEDCVCVRVIAGKPDPGEAPAITPHGSFYQNNLRQFLSGLTGDQRARYRSGCVQSGFQSIAVIPIRHREKILGALHLADDREGMVPLRNISFLEQLSYIIGEAVYRFGVEEERARLVSAVEATPDGIVVADPQGVIQYVNPAFEQITGYAEDEVLGGDLHFLDGEKHREEFYGKLQETLKRNGAWRGLLIHKRKDGTLYYEDCTYSPVMDRSGAIMNYVSVKRDVSEKLRLESIAEAVNTMDNIGYIFSGVRHEIGNPVNTINMIVGILQSKLETLSQESIRGYIDRIMAQVSRVEYLLKSLKSFNMYETQDLRRMSVASFLDSFGPLVHVDFEKRNVALDITVDPEVDAVLADPRALQHVMLNLLTNALDSLSGRSDPRVSVRVFKGGGVVHIRVEDNGCGVPDDKLKDIFKPFYTTKTHGTGLGLVIVKKMVTRMNGTIDIQSHKDVGTTVDITLSEGGPA